MEGVQIDWMAVGIAAFLNMVIGFVWYSNWLFGSVCCSKDKGGYCRFGSFLGALGISLVIAFFLAFFEAYLEITTVLDGMFVGFCFWLGFVATTQIAPVIWKGGSFKLFLIDTGYKLLSFLVMGGIIGA